MDSTCLEQFSPDLLSGDSILDRIIEYVPNNDNLTDTNEGTIGPPLTDELMFESKLIIETTSQQIPTIINNGSNSLNNNLNNSNISSKPNISAKIQNICHQIVRDMNYLGMCVIDNLMEELGNYIRLDVISLYNTVLSV